MGGVQSVLFIFAGILIKLAQQGLYRWSNWRRSEDTKKRKKEKKKKKKKKNDAIYILLS